MADMTNPLLICVVWGLIFTVIGSEFSPGSDRDPVSESPEPSSLRNELDQLKSRISSLESIIDERTQELLNKEESVRNMEMIIQDKSETIMMLQNEIKSLQAAEPSDEKNFKSEEYEQAFTLQKEIFRLKKEIDMQNQKKLRLESRAQVAEKNIMELSSKLDSLLKLSDKQTKRIQEAESSLRQAQGQLARRKLQTSSTFMKFIEVGGEWLPHWLVVHLSHFQSYVVTQWNEHIQPALYASVQKGMEKTYNFMEWSKPHIETLKTKWVPVIKETWVTLATYCELMVQSLATKSIETYRFSSQAMALHLAKTLNSSSVYLEKARKHAEPYIGHFVMVAKPHLERAHVVLRPYTKKIKHAYRKLVESATVYHHQAQELLKNNKITRPLATIELAWFVATGLLSFPVLILLNVCSAVLRGTRPKKYKRKQSAIHRPQRGAKRRHPDK